MGEKAKEHSREGADEDTTALTSEVLLFQRCREGDVEARDELFSLHQGVVGMVVRRLGWGRSDREDLLQVGYIGLLQAIARFDPEKGFRFSTYATHCVEGEIRHFLRDKTETIRRPRWVRQLSSQVAALIERYLHEHNRLPSLSDISEHLNITEEGVQAILRAKQPRSLEEESESGIPLKDRIRNAKLESFRLPIEDRITISQAFETLKAMEQRVIYLFFVQDFTQKEIASKLTLSPRKVSRLMQKALGRLRGQLEGGESLPSKKEL